MNILVLNAGSSSIKYCLLAANAKLEVLQSGAIESIDDDVATVHRWQNAQGEVRVDQLESSNHSLAFEMLFQALSASMEIKLIAHRVVHGGIHFNKAVMINPQVLALLREAVPLAPLHNSANIRGIELAQRHHPQVPQVAVFDTAFHHSMPEHAYRYAVPDTWLQQYGVRRYGFHGTSHSYLARSAASFLAQPLSSLKLITLHLGNGASIAAIDAGRCVDTSMGMTPMEGLMMGTRCGDLDSGVVFALQRQGMDSQTLEHQLNHQSGLKGICGDNDLRRIEQAASAGNTQAKLAIDMFCYRIRKYIGAYFTVLGGIDALVFSGGIGEHSSLIRQKVSHGLECLNIQIDDDRNRAVTNTSCHIEAATSAVALLVIPTDEEYEIAAQAKALLDG